MKNAPTLTDSQGAMGTATYAAMVKARRAFAEAWAAWLADARPTEAEAREEADGTDSQLRQLTALLLTSGEGGADA